MTSEFCTIKMSVDGHNGSTHPCNNLENECALSVKQKLINYAFWFATESVDNCIDAKPIGLCLHSIPEDYLPQQKHAKLKGLGTSPITEE